MSLLTSPRAPAEDKGANILLLDLEGVMTKGMLGGPVSMVQLFHFMSGNAALSGTYSAEATRYVERLVFRHNFRIVLITRHGHNESDILQKRLDHAGIKGEWLYHDPDAIGIHAKDDGIRDWRRRNPDVTDDRIIVLEDEPEKIQSLPRERVIGTDPDKGFTRADFLRVLAVMGLEEVRPGSAASSRQGPPPPRA